MDIFQEAGIYVLVDLGDYTTPESTQVLALGDENIGSYWDNDIYSSYTGFINFFANYSNVLGFVVGQSLKDDEDPRILPLEGLPLVKAAIRDTKALITSSAYRRIPVGFIATNDVFNRGLAASYLDCGNIDESVDFWAVKVDWCGTNGQDLISTYEAYGVPVFFGSYNCSNSTSSSEVGKLYSPDMLAVFSGGF